MNRILALLLYTMAVFYGSTDGFSAVEGAVNINEMHIVWAVPTNHWPSTVWMYKIIPQQFSSAVISNLMVLGEFKAKNKTKMRGQVPGKDKQFLYFANKDRSRHLGISPAQGWIEYHDENARAPLNTRSVNVPSEQEVYQLGLDLLRRAGIDRSQLATKGDTAQFRVYHEEGRHGWIDKARGTNIDEVITRGLDFIRRVDGIDFNGIGPWGGVCMTFGNNGKVVDLEIMWKGLEPFVLQRTLSPETMMNLIMSGAGEWRPPLGNPNAIRKITLTDMAPFYKGVDGEDEVEKFIRPCARVAAVVEYGYTNIVTNFECPITAEEARKK